MIPTLQLGYTHVPFDGTANRIYRICAQLNLERSSHG